MSAPVVMGTILILREEFRKIAKNPNQPGAFVVRAELMGNCLDELIARREKEAADAEVVESQSASSEGQ